MSQPPTEQPKEPEAPAFRRALKRLMEIEASVLKKVAVAFLAVFAVAAPIYCILSEGPLTNEVTVIIPRGASVQEISNRLEKNGVLSSRAMFFLASKIIARDNLQAGEYKFTAGQTIADVVLQMRDGRSVVRKFTVPEGLTSNEIVNLIKNEPSFSGEILEIPPEGSLLPETYHYVYGESREAIIARMRNDMSELLASLWETRAEGLPIKNQDEALIIASIIEKETGKKVEERARVAGVFYNRLRIGMKLQSDPTTIYAITKGAGPLDRALTRKDLNVYSPYNTYVYAGLPPMPICNPGRASIEAALLPEKNDFLYFVADGTGGHAFATNLVEHNRNVAKWLSLSKP